MGCAPTARSGKLSPSGQQSAHPQLSSKFSVLPKNTPSYSHIDPHKLR